PCTPPHTTLFPYTTLFRSVDGAIVLGFHAPYMDVVVPNDYLADYIRTEPDRLVGFASVNPVEPGAREELERSYHDLGLRGLKLGDRKSTRLNSSHGSISYA